jgi:hypothetical protein
MTTALTCDEVDRQLRSVARDVLALILAAEPTKARPLSEVFREARDDGRLGSLRAYNDVVALVKAQSAMQEDARMRSGGDPEGRGLDNAVGMFLSTYLQNAITENYLLNEACIETLIEDACAFLIDGVHQIHTLHFLKGISLLDSVSLGNLTVRPISHAERDKLLATLSRWVGSFRAAIVTDGSVVIVEQRTTSTPSNVARTFSDTKRATEAMIAFLRIHATSSLVAICEYADRGSLWPNSSIPYPAAIERAGIEVVALEPTMFVRWNEDRQVLLAPPPALKVALRRFEILSDYENPDRILDQTIILEALFSDDEKQELAHKLSLRIANLLGRDFEERKSLFKMVKDGYTARSKLSHGRELTPALRGIDQRFSELVRRALAQYLTYVHRNRVTNGAGESDFIRTLDERSLGGPPVV